MRKRLTSANISLGYTLAQRFLDKSNHSMIDIMTKISKFLITISKTYYTTTGINIIVINVESIQKMKTLIDY